MRIRRASSLLQLSFALGLATSTPAGVVILTTGNDGLPPPPCAGIAASDGQGGIWSAGGCDDGRGFIVFVVPKNVQESTDSFAYCKAMEGNPHCRRCEAPVPFPQLEFCGRMKFDRAQGVTLALVEPFKIETFAALSSNVRIVASVDVQEYLADNPFPNCSDISITNGSAPQTTHAVFKDGATLSSDRDTALAQLLNPAVVNALPNFTGTARVCDQDTFSRLSDVPELSVLGWLALASLLLLSSLWC